MLSAYFFTIKPPFMSILSFCLKKTFCHSVFIPTIGTIPPIPILNKKVGSPIGLPTHYSLLRFEGLTPSPFQGTPPISYENKGRVSQL